jgi:hypothetical protein
VRLAAESDAAPRHGEAHDATAAAGAAVPSFIPYQRRSHGCNDRRSNFKKISSKLKLANNLNGVTDQLAAGAAAFVLQLCRIGMVKRERQQWCSYSEQRRPRRRTTARAVIRLTSSYPRAILTRGSRRHHDPDAPVPDSVDLVPPWFDAERYLPIRATPYVLVRSSDPFRPATPPLSPSPPAVYCGSNRTYPNKKRATNAGRLIDRCV